MSYGYSDYIADRDFEESQRGCRRCGGQGWSPIRGAGNYMAVEPCGCDEDPECEGEE